jgi:UDP-glucose 4-epimerase
MSNKLNLLIIGGNSFVAKSFIAYHQHNYTIKTVSRNKTLHTNEYIVSDYSRIPTELFDGVDVVLNCTAIVHQLGEVADFVYNKINFELASGLAENAKIMGVKTFIQLSTIAVYGNAELINSSTIENPTNSYGESKLKADKKIMLLANDSFSTLIFRPPMIYGGEDSPGNMMRLVKIVEKGLPLPFKNASNKRDFINVHNFVDFIEVAIKINKTNIYLVTDSAAISTHELVSLISKHLGKKTIQFSVPTIFLNILKKVKPDLIDKLFGTLSIDPTKSIETLKHKPIHTVESGIVEMIKWYQKKKLNV